jgi:hypothetical protein
MNDVWEGFPVTSIGLHTIGKSSHGYFVACCFEILLQCKNNTMLNSICKIRYDSCQEIVGELSNAPRRLGGYSLLESVFGA